MDVVIFVDNFEGVTYVLYQSESLLFVQSFIVLPVDVFLQITLTKLENNIYFFAYFVCLDDRNNVMTIAIFMDLDFVGSLFGWFRHFHGVVFFGLLVLYTIHFALLPLAQLV